MNNSLIHIDRYFNGELSQDEKKLFEERCLADPGFAREVANYILMRDQAKAQWVQQKKQDFDTLAQDENNESALIVPIKTKYGLLRKIGNWRQMGVAAALVSIIVLAFIVYLQLRKTDNSQLVNEKKEDVIKNKEAGDTIQHSNIDTGINKNKEVPIHETDLLINEQLVARNFKLDSPPENTDGLLAEAFNEYKEGDYKNAIREYDNAIEMMEDLSTRSAEDEKEAAELMQLLFYAHYYNGLSNFAQGRTGKAIAELKAIKKSPDKFWQNKVHWYLALAYLKTGKVKDAQKLLSQVAESRHSGVYKQKSLSLLAEIK